MALDSSSPSGKDGAEFDPDALRDKYRSERDKRLILGENYRNLLQPILAQQKKKQG